MMRRHRSFDPTVEITTVKPSNEQLLHIPAEKSIDKDEDATLLISTAGVAGLMLAAHLVRKRFKQGGNT